MSRKRTAVPEQLPEETRRRLGLITLVQAGQLTAREAAKRMGVSPKTYYVWERRYLASLTREFQEQPAGRPAAPTNPEMERLATENADLRRRLGEREAELKAGALFSQFRSTLQEVGIISSPDKKRGR